MKYVDYDIVFQEIPDETTLAINISNCPFRCKDCHSPHLREDIGEELTEKVIIDLLNKYKDVTCILFMGGDSNIEELNELAGTTLLRKELWDIKTAWYTGATEIPDNLELCLFDYIKLGPYIPEKGGLDNPDTNQKLMKFSMGEGWQDITHKFWK